MELAHRQSQVGKFLPWLEHPDGPVAQPSFFVIPNLIARDQAFFLDTVGTVTVIMLRRKGIANDVWIRGYYRATEVDVGSRCVP